MLYPQNGNCVVTIDSVTSFHPMYKVRSRNLGHAQFLLEFQKMLSIVGRLESRLELPRFLVSLNLLGLQLITASLGLHIANIKLVCVHPYSSDHNTTLAAGSRYRSTVGTRRPQLSIHICCPRPSSAANQLHITAGVDRRDRRTNWRTDGPLTVT